ncbi:MULTISPECIES: diacylglycerol/lipid kinase family protein [unclassified Nocardioides]|uniref:diacylglycerol/lipid kinase family protein n=1 Tax=unclassified Nocardioides TaxID=2615069 RepID=UPI0006FAABA4|nr:MULTISPECIES: diacylglycerol kinase family protein [unclassified Nocardioides]KQY57585.1 diacylglycerol kinase [Nocardioides sp. Root140]KRF15119.1 diacylglycerol kinase [Nocardioides sp. Soil796]
MTRSFSFLVNPSSGGGAAPGAVVPVARLLRDAGAAVDVTYSPGPKATHDLVSGAVERGDVVVSVGGDGMLSSIAGEVSRLGGTLGIVPAGRGNDFARMLELPDEPDAVARILLDSVPTPTDLVRATLPDGTSHDVAGSVYAGVDAKTADLVNRMQWLPKKLQYPAATVRALATFNAASYTVDVDGDSHDFAAATVVVANSGYYGKGMHIAPSASVDDGELDVIVIEAAGRFDMIRSFPKVYDGRHIDLDQVHVFRGRAITLTSRPGVVMGGDGEPLGMLGDAPVRIEVLPGAVNILR